MNSFKKFIFPIFSATIWISFSEFIRNEVLLKSYWTDHYNKLGLVFPSEAINGAVWGFWSLLFAVAIFIISKKFSFLETIFLSWFIGFVLMWVVLGNMGVLPDGLLYSALPLSLLEVIIATFIIDKLNRIK